MTTYRTLGEIRAALDTGILTCRELVLQYLHQIEKHGDLNAFLEVFKDEALARAEVIDEKYRAGKAGRLAGMVLGIKDVLCYKGHKVQSSSRILEGFESLFTATAVQRLLDEDVIIIGRLNCDEFAMGSSNENSAYGAVKNPLDTSTVPGGSSGGSAAAVAAGMCHAALGSDTGGSIRQPASFCGIVGLKPTYGRISRYGLLAYASSFDQIGPMTQSVEDAALLLEIMAGSDECDNTASSVPVDAYTDVMENSGNERFRIGYIKEALDRPGLDPEVRKSVFDMIESLKKEGHEVKEVSFPYLDYAVPAYYVLTTAEASSNLARYDGIRFGYRSPNAKNIEEVYRFSRTEGFGKEVKRRIVLGTFVLSAGFYDAYYQRAQKVRQLIRQATDSILSDCDFILSPTTPGTAFQLGGKVDDPIAMYLSDIFTVHANLAGNPAISLPLGSHSNGMPFGIQVLGKRFEEGKLLAFSGNLMQKKEPVS